jgi:L-ascorbate metabolism protein UlaG (beta-lactamase superfamily)
MTPEQAVAAAVVLRARLLVPIHYGVSGAEGYAEIPDAETALAAAAARRAVSVEIVPPGDWLRWLE